MQIASVYSDSNWYRPSHFVAVEMDVTDTTAKVYYGRLMKLIQFRLRADPNLASPPDFREGEYTVAVLQWADRMKVGGQSQIYKVESRSNAFGSQTMEDPCIMQRLISVVEHAVPSGSGTHSGRKQRRTYFLDDLVHMDYLLHPQKRSEDRLNRVLKGIQRR